VALDSNDAKTTRYDRNKHFRDPPVKRKILIKDLVLYLEIGSQVRVNKLVLTSNCQKWRRV